MVITNSITKILNSKTLTLTAEEAFGDIELYKTNEDVYIEAVITMLNNGDKYLIRDANISKKTLNDKYIEITLNLDGIIPDFALNFLCEIKITTQFNIWDFNKTMISEANYDWYRLYRDTLRRFVGAIDIDNPPTKTPLGDEILLGAIGYDSKNNTTVIYTSNGWVDLERFNQLGISFYSRNEADDTFAFKNGDENETFSVATPISDKDAINKEMLVNTENSLTEYTDVKTNETRAYIDEQILSVREDIKEDLKRDVYYIPIGKLTSSDTSGVINTLQNTTTTQFYINDNTYITFNKEGTYLISIKILLKNDETDSVLNVLVKKTDTNGNTITVKTIFFDDLDTTDWAHKEYTLPIYLESGDKLHLEWNNGKIGVWEDPTYSSIDIVKIGGTYQ